jgi:hypothetical protein
MGCDPAGDQIEHPVLKGQILGVSEFEGDVFGSFWGGKGACCLQHLGRDVRGDHLGHKGRKLERGMPAPRRNVQDDPIRSWLGDLDQAIQLFPMGMGMAGHVALGEFAVALLR